MNDRILLRDDSGSPLVFCHGARPGCVYSIQNVLIPEADAAYFSTNEEYASGFTEGLFGDAGERGLLHRAHLAFRNPKYLRFPEDFDTFSQRGFNRSHLMAEGYDGLLLILPVIGAVPKEVLAAVFDRESIIPIFTSADVPSPCIAS